MNALLKFIKNLYFTFSFSTLIQACVVIYISVSADFAPNNSFGVYIVWKLRFFPHSWSIYTSDWQTVWWTAMFEADFKTQQQTDSRRYTFQDKFFVVW